MVETKKTPWPLLPFVWLWNFVAAIVKLAGRLVAVLLGLLLLIAGAILTVTVVGAILGIPLLVVGFLLVMRGLF